MELFFSALIIFCLRLADQSLGTMRNLLVNKSKPLPAALIGLIESAIWVLAVSEVIKDIYDPFLIGAYAFGFATGTIIGSYIENILAVGNVVIRVFCPADSPSIANTLRDYGYGVTVLNGEGRDGAVNIYWCVVPRRKEKEVLSIISEINPNTYITKDASYPISLSK